MLLSDQELLGRLVAFDSVSRSRNTPIADFICEYLDRPGITVTRNPPRGRSKVNIVATTGPPSSDEGEAAGQGLALCGHLDVVPADELGWNSPPFELTETDGNLVGRGACDMKCSVALAMNLLAEAASNGVTRPLAAVFTYDEELGSLGAQRFCQTWSEPLPRRVVVGEPTGLRVVRLHKGHLSFRVTVRGRAAHSGSPQLGTNAIEAAGRVIQAISRLGEQLKMRRLDNSQFFPAVPFPVLGIATIQGGTAINIIPDQCVIEGGLRLLPGMNDEAAIAQIRDAVAKSAPGILQEVELINNNPPLLCPENASLNMTLCKLIGQTKSFGVGFASDAGWLSRTGYECVLFGPGSIEVAHKANEFVPIAELASARQTLGRLVEKLCG